MNWRRWQMRQWLMSYQEMKQPLDLYWFEEQGIRDTEDLAREVSDQESFLMQCTGMRDAAGADIYEGDIVRVAPGSGWDGLYVVGYDNHAAAFTFESGAIEDTGGGLWFMSNDVRMPIRDPWMLEVVGHRYNLEEIEERVPIMAGA